MIFVGTFVLIAVAGIWVGILWYNEYGKPRRKNSD